MSPANALSTRPRPEPEVLAAQVRGLLAPIFGGHDLPPVPAVTDPINGKPAPAARALVLA